MSAYEGERSPDDRKDYQDGREQAPTVEDERRSTHNPTMSRRAR